MTELEATGVGEHPPPYMIFVVVFLFFLTGLMGFLVCHLLKMKGYRCRAGDMDDDEEEEEEKLGGIADDEHEDNQDTVDQILKCIMENEANMEAFNEMLGNHNVCVRHDPRLRKESIGGVPPHHHTVHSGTEHNSCHLCAQVRSKKGRRQSRTPRFKQRPGEQTVFSVGRFRVTHTDKKLHGSPNQMVSSGDHLDQSQDSEEQKGGYNLRSMFKDARPTLENANGAVPNVGKRRKSLTLFGLRRGSDPVGIKVIEGTGRETGAVKFAIQKQPVVLEDVVQEEVVQVENTEMPPQSSAKPGLKPEIKPSKNQIPASLQAEVKMSGSVNSSSRGKKESHDFSSVPQPCADLTTKPSSGSTSTSTPSSLFVSSPKKKLVHVADRMLQNEDPGPLQTSTPIVAMAGSIPGFTPITSTSKSVFPVTQTPPDPDSSPDLEQGIGASLALISLGSSPQSSFPIKTPSSSSLLKTPTSSQADLSPVPTPSPKVQPSHAVFSQYDNLSQTASPLEAPTLSPLLCGNPKPDNIPVSLKISSSSPLDQNPSFRSSPNLTLKSGSVMSATSMTKGDTPSGPLHEKEQALPLARFPKSELKSAEFLKSAEHSPVGGLKGSVLSSPSDQFSKDRLTSLSLSPSSPLSPSSSVGGRISSVAIVKASPDSKREFSVVTMVEEAEPSTSVKDQKGEMYEVGDKRPAAGQAWTGQPERHTGETASLLSQEKDDMVEMEDIRDCKVMQEEEREEKEEKVERTLHTQD